MSKKINLLMVSFHFPPIASSSGYLRCLKFAKYLDKKLFDIDVLTTTTGAYQQTNRQNLALLDDLDIAVHRATGLDASRHLSVFGRYLECTTWPDKWSSWIPFAAIKALSLHRTKHFDIIWVTFPIASALVIGLVLAKLTKKPLIVDIRDPIWEEETWQDTTRNKLLRWIERKIFMRATLITFTSPGTINKYRKRYPELIAEKAQLLTNGYDEADFANLQPKCSHHGKKIFLHSGLIPKYERDPEAFFVAIATLKKRGIVTPSQHEFRLRACGHTELYAQRVKDLEIHDLVSFPEAIAYQQALAEMRGADALMIFQDATCNWQIPAKLFEYFRVEKPILAWSDVTSDTGNLLAKHCDNYVMAPLQDSDKIAIAIENFLQKDAWQNQNTDVSQFSRQALTRQLETLLVKVASNKADT
jgi:hypothetical protein